MKTDCKTFASCAWNSSWNCLSCQTSLSFCSTERAASVDNLLFSFLLSTIFFLHFSLTRRMMRDVDDISIIIIIVVRFFSSMWCFFYSWHCHHHHHHDEDTKSDMLCTKCFPSVYASFLYSSPAFMMYQKRNGSPEDRHQLRVKKKKKEEDSSRSSSPSTASSSPERSDREEEAMMDTMTEEEEPVVKTETVDATTTSSLEGQLERKEKEVSTLLSVYFTSRLFPCFLSYAFIPSESLSLLYPIFSLFLPSHEIVFSLSQWEAKLITIEKLQSTVKKEKEKREKTVCRNQWLM